MKEDHDFEKAVRRAMLDLRGIFALSIINADEPDMIIAVDRARPWLSGWAIVSFLSLQTFRQFFNTRATSFFLGDGEMAIINKDAVRVTDFEANSVQPSIQRITWDPIMAEKGGFKHFMLKEIYEQPRSVRDTMQGRISLDTGRVFLDEMKNITEADFKRFTSIKIAACGTSWHAGLAGKYMIEQLARIQVDVDYASEFRYRDPVMDENTLLLVITQSGETADTIAALREAQELGSKVLAICNVNGSMITREADGTILTHAGPEIGVASTKAFTCQMVALYLLGLYLGNLRGTLSPVEAQTSRAATGRVAGKARAFVKRVRLHRRAFERVFPFDRFSLSRSRHQLSRSLWKAR